MRRLGLAGLACLVAAASLDAQTIRAGVQGAMVSHTERSEAFQYDGFGVAGFAGLRVGKLGLEGSALMASLEPDEETGLTETVKTRQFDVTASYYLAPAIALQVGASGRTVDPEYALQDVGLVRVGLRSENALSRIARVWIRGAYLAAPKFNGGGTAGFSFEVGLGTFVGSADGRFGLRAEYDFQRIDREIGDTDQSPIQVMVARVGLQVGF